MHDTSLINCLQNLYEGHKIDGADSSYKDMLEKEYIKALEGKFDVTKIYKTKDGRYKVSRPVQIIKPERISVLEALYQYYYGFETVESVYKAWLADFEGLVREGHRSWDTYDRYKSDWLKYFDGSKLSSMDISKVRISDIKKHYRMITANQSLSRKALANAKSLLNHVFDYALDEDLVSSNLARSVNTRDLICMEVDNGAKVYSEEEREAVIKSAVEKDNAYCRAIVLMFCTCTRIGEIEALKWDDVDFEKRSIYIHSSMRRTRDEKGRQIHVWTDTTKSRLSSGKRTLPMSDRAYEALKRQRHETAFCEYVFMENGHPLDTTQFNRWLKRCCSAARVEYLSSHKIRFTTVTMMIDSGVSLGKAQKMAGHARTSTTEGYVRNCKTAAVGFEDWNEIFD